MSAIFCSVAQCHRYVMRTTAMKRWGHANIDFICGFHWKRLTKAEKLVWRRINMLKRKLGLDHLGHRERRIWSAFKRRVA